ncbi:hypothetical protein BJX63DRAFT_273679 [Aspergillus granulosus]|uniref:Zn(2)-C6 fungal-type domain-containing protein n=1 Tax=Aspergillus granulosus TaxID=176169 RepID=A0ABR4H8D4_9EURO
MLTLFGFQQKTYHPRRAHRKSRAGCLTCKKRRVKCDETHPICHHCIRTGWLCSWPDIQPPGQAQFQILQPPPGQDTYSALSIPSTIPSRIFQTQREARFFDFFRLHTVADLSGWSPSPFWQRLVLQMVHSEPAARRAAIALGALHVEGAATEFTLRCYGEALATLRSHITNPGTVLNIDVCLTTCLLLSCFEIARKDYPAAQIHYAGGLGILKRYKRGVRPQGHLASASEEPLHTTFFFLETHVIAFLSNRPSPGYTQEPIYTSSSSQSSSTSSSFQPFSLADLTLFIPLNFPSLSAATESFLRIQNAIQSATTQVTYQMAFSHSLPVPNDEGMYPHREAYGASVAFPEGLGGLLREGLGILKMWERAFEDMVATSGFGFGGEDDENGGRSLHDERVIALLRGLASILMIRCSRDPGLGEMGYDIFQPQYEIALGQFERSVELAWSKKEASRGNAPQPQPLFSLALGVLHGLYDLIAKCRDLSIRERGLDILSRMPFREGLWDGRNARRVNEAIISFEERYRIPGIGGPAGIPAEHRLVGVNFMFSPGRFKIIADSGEGRGVCWVELD